MTSRDYSEDSFPQLPPPKVTRRLVDSPQSTDLPSGASASATEKPERNREDNSPYEAVGPYRLVKRLGQGGMGTVFLAENQNLNRRVALKLLTEGNFASEELQQRFEFEARVAANLQHENIVRVFDFGKATRGPYIVFEFVEGQTLAEAIRGTSLQPTDAARILIQLAKAVHYAHQNHVVHRDLKPANVLLDAARQPKITDFGLARSVANNSGLTKTGEVMGTPAYMSPEQATGASNLIGPPSDIYSLGAILFELLTGTPPFRGPDAVAIVLAVVTMEPPSLRQLDRSIPRDLETICLKCLAKQVSKRYSTALELAEDLDRYLNGIPIVARPTSIFEKSWKLAKRYPAATSLIATAVLGLVAFAWYGQWKNNQLSVALSRSDSNFREALKAAQRRIESVGLPAEQALQEELEFLQTIRDRPDDGVATRYEIPIAASIAGQIHLKLGHTQEALNALREAESELQKLVYDDPRWNDWYRSELASVFVTRAQAEQSQGKMDEAESSLLRGLKLFQQLSAREPENGDLQREQAALLNNLGIHAGRNDKQQQAREYYQQSIEIKQQLVQRNPSNSKLRSELIVSLTNLSSNLVAQHELSVANELLLQAQLNLESLPVSARSTVNSRMSEAGIQLSLARIAASQDDRKKLSRHFEDSIKVLKQLASDYPEVPSYQVRCAEVEVEYGQALMTSDEVPEDSNQKLTQGARRILDAALQQFQSAETRYARLSQLFPDEASYHSTLQSLRPGIQELRQALANEP